MAFAALLNQEARALEADGIDVIQFDEPAFNVYMSDVKEWGIEALHRAIDGLKCTTAVHICYGYGIKANIDWKQSLGAEWRQYEEIFPALAKSRIGQVSVECIDSHVPMNLLKLLDGKDVLVGAIDVATDTIETPERVAAVLGDATKCGAISPWRSSRPSRRAPHSRARSSADRRILRERDERRRCLLRQCRESRTRQRTSPAPQGDLNGLHQELDLHHCAWRDRCLHCDLHGRIQRGRDVEGSGPGLLGSSYDLHQLGEEPRRKYHAAGVIQRGTGANRFPPLQRDLRVLPWRPRQGSG
jgi:hypothetical protein